MGKVISIKEVQHIANLSRLYFEDEEFVKFELELNKILGYFNELQELDTENVKPTAHAVNVPLSKRKDEVTDSLNREEVLEHAPLSSKGFFVVDKTF